jgi:4'-phosphopantetheinyl transferase
MIVAPTEPMHPRLLENPSLSKVRIWQAQIELISEEEVDALRAYLDEAERSRAARFHFERDRKSFVSTRGLLRSLLGGILEKEPASIVFEYGEHGKPALAARNDLQFSVSHTTGWAMFAVSSDFAVGVDLEALDRVTRNTEDLAKFADRVLSTNELMVWRAIPADQQPRALLRAWTRKEALAKATGRGLSDELLATEVALDAAAPQSTLAVEHWCICDLPAPEGFAAALAVDQNRSPNTRCSHGPVGRAPNTEP